MDKAKDRLNHIESSLLTKENNLQFYDFKKNNEFSTLYDDKKLLAKMNSTPLLQQNNNMYNNQFLSQNNNTNLNYNNNPVNQNPYSYRTSAQYGAFFQNQLSQPF